MSRRRNNIGKKFALFAKTYDENGMVVEDECGWICASPEVKLTPFLNRATLFVEKETGHGSPDDWKKLFEDEHPEWKINPPKYVFND